MNKIALSAVGEAAPEVDTGLLTGWLNRTDLARELTLSVDTLQRWETRRMGPPCVRVGRKVLYRMEAVRDWLREQGGPQGGSQPCRRRSALRGRSWHRSSPSEQSQSQR